MARSGKFQTLKDKTGLKNFGIFIFISVIFRKGKKNQQSFYEVRILKERINNKMFLLKDIKIYITIKINSLEPWIKI